MGALAVRGCQARRCHATHHALRRVVLHVPHHRRPRRVGSRRVKQRQVHGSKGAAAVRDHALRIAPLNRLLQGQHAVRAPAAPAQGRECGLARGAT